MKFNINCDSSFLSPLGFPSPRITTLSLGGVVAPNCDKEGRK